jgi:tRNA pseudouridine55 synthase
MSEGILNINKPRGPTSHDLVDQVRALTGIRRVGHAGTLDPLATGVLLICVGRATRVAEYLAAGMKRYRARLLLGIATDTYDAEGKITAETEVAVERAELEAALDGFRGTIQQLPPMYSAIKHQGKPLHRLARRGETVERQPREVEIYELALTDWDPPECTIELACSAGTYVRALAHDLGQSLGCGASLAALTRLASGSFSLEDSVSVEELSSAAAGGRWTDLLLPLDAALSHLPALTLADDEARRVRSGQPVPGPDAVNNPQGLARAYGADGAFLAIVAFDQATKTWRPRKVFAPPEQ